MASLLYEEGGFFYWRMRNTEYGILRSAWWLAYGHLLSDSVFGMASLLYEEGELANTEFRIRNTEWRMRNMALGLVARLWGAH